MMKRFLKYVALILGAFLIYIVGIMWWAGEPPPRPAFMSARALYFEPAAVPFSMHKTGNWIDCRFDEQQSVNRCVLADPWGKTLFEDVFVPYEGSSPVPEAELVFDTRQTGSLWTYSRQHGRAFPIIYLKNGQILLPRGEYESGKETVDWSRGKRHTQ
jgi:hypothetical protein